MRRLTEDERIALRPIGPEGEGPISQSTFDGLEALGWGAWMPDGEGGLVWVVTPAGRRALELDDLAAR